MMDSKKIQEYLTRKTRDSFISKYISKNNNSEETEEVNLNVDIIDLENDDHIDLSSQEYEPFLTDYVYDDDYDAESIRPRSTIDIDDNIEYVINKILSSSNSINESYKHYLQSKLQIIFNDQYFKNQLRILTDRNLAVTIFSKIIAFYLIHKFRNIQIEKEKKCDELIIKNIITDLLKDNNLGNTVCIIFSRVFNNLNYILTDENEIVKFIKTNDVVFKDEVFYLLYDNNIHKLYEVIKRFNPGIDIQIKLDVLKKFIVYLKKEEPKS